MLPAHISNTFPIERGGRLSQKRPHPFDLELGGAEVPWLAR